MDMREAQLIVQVIKSGSHYFKAPHADDYEMGKEGIFIHYDPETNLFKLRHYEKADLDCRDYGYDEKLDVSSQDLLLMLTGKLRFDQTWGRLTEPDNYVFDPVFDPESRRAKYNALRAKMNIRDLQYLRCEHCRSYNVEPTSYRADINQGQAVRYASLGVHCFDCQQESLYKWDD